MNITGYDCETDTYIVERLVDDKEIEQERGSENWLTAPRITLEDIENTIASELYARGEQAFTDYPYSVSSPLRCLTICVLVLKNGFMVIGESACISPENFDVDLGREIARQKAVDKVWMLEGYVLKQRLFERNKIEL